MDFSAQLDKLQQRAADAKASAQAAVSESRDQLRQRIDQAKAEVDQKATDARQDAQTATDKARRWTRRAGRVPVLRDPANGNRAVPLTHEQSRYGFANAAADHRRRAGPHHALASLSIRA